MSFVHLPYPPTPEHAPMFAALARENAWEISRIDLDDTPKSLAKLDELLDRFRNEGVTPEKLGATLFSFGCYVGEVFVRECGAVWVETAETPLRDLSGGHPIVLELDVDSYCNPIGKVWKRLENGDEDSIAYFFTAFGKKRAGHRPWWRKIWT